MMLLQAGQAGLYRKDSIWTDEIPPEMVAGATLWIDGTDTTTLWNNTDFTTSNVSSDGAPIGSANSNVNTAIGMASVNSVELKTPAVNGASAIVFGTPTGLMRLSSSTENLPASTVITAGTKLIFVAVKVTAAVSGGGAPYNEDAILSDGDRYFFGLHFYEASGPTGDLTAVAHNQSGGVTNAVTRTFPRDQWVVLTMSHQSGQLRLRVNGGAWATISSGNSNSITAALNLGDTTYGTARRFELAHLAIVNTGQTDAAISAVEHWLANDLGITPWW